MSSLEQRIERAEHACGCHAGAVALLASTFVAVAWWVMNRDGRIVLAPQAALAAVAIVVTTVAAKFASIALSRAWRRHALARLAR